MIPRDWQRLAFNLILGPPIAYLVALIALCLMLAIPAWMNGSDAGLVVFVLFVGVPAIPLSYLFGIVPALLISIVTSILSRFLGPASFRVLAAALIGIVPYWLLAAWLVGPQRQFDSAELNAMLTLSAPIGGALASAACAALVERFGSKRGTPEEAAA
jgi:hypothetical protein